MQNLARRASRGVAGKPTTTTASPLARHMRWKADMMHGWYSMTGCSTQAAGEYFERVVPGSCGGNPPQAACAAKTADSHTSAQDRPATELGLHVHSAAAAAWCDSRCSCCSSSSSRERVSLAEQAAQQAPHSGPCMRAYSKQTRMHGNVVATGVPRMWA